jgi:hypothetical protein
MTGAIGSASRDASPRGREQQKEWNDSVLVRMEAIRDHCRRRNAKVNGAEWSGLKRLSPRPCIKMLLGCAFHSRHTTRPINTAGGRNEKQDPALQ